MIEKRARLRLTVGFAAVQLSTYAIFALAVYAYVTATFDFDGIADGGSSETAEAGFATLRSALILAFAGLAVVAPLSSWVLAGLAMRPVTATLAAQRRFVDDAAHELRTPLTAVQGQLELALLRPRSGAQYRESLRRALDAARALGQTTEDLLLASENAQEQPAPAVVSVRDAVDAATALLAEPRRVRIEQRGDPRVQASATALRRVLTNLLVNACKYSATGDAASDPVIVRIGMTMRWAVVEVADTGIGMTPIETRRAFDRFWQADSSRASDGNGLGLSIVRDIAASLRGDVRIESAPGRGTTVRVRLPLSRSSHGGLRSVGIDGATRPKGS